MRFPAPPERWNDWLALLLVIGVPVLWVFGTLTETVIGATIAGWMLVIQFYFRRTAPDTSIVTTTTTQAIDDKGKAVEEAVNTDKTTRTTTS